MARNQGLNRLVKSVERDLQKSEKERGYIFVSKDDALKDDCDGEITLFIDGLRIGTRTIDEHGRIFPRLGYAQKIKNSKTISLQYDPITKSLEITFT